jgi:hypothetical protein
VREIHNKLGERRGSLLIENKYFQDGRNEKPQTVSINGAGNFNAEVGHIAGELLLSLVRVYGTVIRDERTGPVVDVKYLRVWRWGEYRFSDYGQQLGDPKWRPKLRNGEPVYQDSLSAEYYIHRLRPIPQQADYIRSWFGIIASLEEPVRDTPTTPVGQKP